MTYQDITNLLDYKRYFEKLFEHRQVLFLEGGDNSRFDDYMDRIEEFKRELKNMIEVEVEQDDEILRELNLIEEILERMIDNGQITFECDNNVNFKYIIDHIEKITDGIYGSDLNSTEELRCENRRGIIEMGKYI